MAKQNPEVRLLIRILGIAGFIIIFLLLAGYIFIRVRVPQLLEFSKGITEYRVNVKLDSLEGAVFITGMTGCENICLEEDTTGFYVSCLDGNIIYIDSDSKGNPGIRRSFRAGNAVMGMSIDKEGRLLAAVSENPLKEWRTKGGSVCRISESFDSLEKLSADFPSINGICNDDEGNLYFTSSNFNLINPRGDIYRMIYKGESGFGEPELFIRNAGLANGLFCRHSQDKIYFSNTFGGIYEFSPQDSHLTPVYLKLRFMEACDDLCTDIAGNLWMTDPGNSTIKMFNPGTGRLVRFAIEGIGQASSCRIRSENGREMIYISELKKSYKPTSSIFDGRGVLVVPAQSLLKLIQVSATR